MRAAVSARPGWLRALIHAIIYVCRDVRGCSEIMACPQRGGQQGLLAATRWATPASGGTGGHAPR